MSIKSTILGEKYRIIEQIGQGSFGKVYLAHELTNPSIQVAIKTEPLKQPYSQLLREI